ncbi:MAG: polysaccharide deacetylase family protein [Hyphomicrobium sp.]
MSARPHVPSVLKSKEVVLTFDDGPMPWVTRSILDTLDQFCAKATFFSVGRMALAYPATLRDVMARGHTLGTHTFSHPFRLPRMAPSLAHNEIERGFAAVAAAAGTPIAPFFRFTGLSDSAALIAYLESRQIAAFTVDIVTNDSYIHDPAELTKRTLAAVEARGGGIILFHDIKTTTAKALPGILQGLAARGYRIAHFVSKAPAAPRPELLAEYAPRVASISNAEGKATTLLPFYGARGPAKENVIGQLSIIAARATSKGSAAAGGSVLAGWKPVDLSQKPGPPRDARQFPKTEAPKRGTGTTGANTEGKSSKRARDPSAVAADGTSGAGARNALEAATSVGWSTEVSGTATPDPIRTGSIKKR